jgi:C4-dicarboxylate-specific signal transduction histidine kinase
MPHPGSSGRAAACLPAQRDGPDGLDEAHELNQPLTAVTNYLEAGRQLFSAGVGGPERINEMMEKAIGQAQRAGDVIRRLRGWSARVRPIGAFKISTN